MQGRVVKPLRGSFTKVRKFAQDGTIGTLIGPFLQCINGTLKDPSLLEHGLAATLVTTKALESHCEKRIAMISPEDYYTV